MTTLREKYHLLSFELSDKFSAWFKESNGLLHETQIHAIGMAALSQLVCDDTTGRPIREEPLGNVIVGLQFTDEGVAICEEFANFSCVLPKGQTPDGPVCDPLNKVKSGKEQSFAEFREELREADEILGVIDDPMSPIENEAWQSQAKGRLHRSEPCPVPPGSIQIPKGGSRVDNIDLDELVERVRRS